MKWAAVHIIIHLLCVYFITIDGLAVMSVDLGSEWIKVGVVSPGVPMEIALNKESKRKTPNVISFRDNVRSFGEDAQTVGTRFPKSAYSYFLDLMGKNISHPIVKLFQKRFSYYDLIPDEERGSVMFKHDENSYHSPEELIAQVLMKCKEMAEQSTQQAIKECVITVPGYFNQAERKSLLQAAELANLKVLQLINDYSAVALNYGIYRSKEFSETPQYVLFYDMGASSTTASLVSYQIVKTKERGYAESHPQISILGVGFDRTLGGLEIQIRLRDYLAKAFMDMKKTKGSVFDNPRAMAKLFKEAGRLKNILSANTDHYAQIEGLLEDQDFRYKVTRDDLENLLPDFFERVSKPVEQALKIASVKKDVISHVVLFGAGTRVPKVQEILQKSFGKSLTKNINTDEAAALGAVYKAADLSTGFQVKKFIVKDAVIYPIQVVFERGTEDGIRQVKRTLFGLLNPYPQKKVITFNKYTSDFSFNVNYADLDHLPKDEVMNIGSLNLTEVRLFGITDAIKKYSSDNVDFKGIKAHFAINDSGILNLLNVELLIEKSVTEQEEEGTLSKLGSTISKLFGGEEAPQENIEVAKEKLHVEENEHQDGPNATEKVKNDPNKNVTDNLESKGNKTKVIVIKEAIKAEENILCIQSLNNKQFEIALEKLKTFDKIDREVTRRATALNNLESFVIEVQNKLDEQEFIDASTSEERKKIKTLCDETSEWLYNEGSDADAETYEKKLAKLKNLTNDLFFRVWEHKERPEALTALNKMLNHSYHFMLSAKNLTNTANPEKDVFTDIEIGQLEKLIKETEEWKNKLIDEQEKVEAYEQPKITVKMITEKMSGLDREVKYLINKMKIWQPKTKSRDDKPTVDEVDNKTVSDVEEESIKTQKNSDTEEEENIELNSEKDEHEQANEQHTEL